MNNNTMKPPNERFVLNASQATIVVQAAAAKAAANKYVYNAGPLTGMR